jgi:hypothetical protein
MLIGRPCDGVVIAVWLARRMGRGGHGTVWVALFTTESAANRSRRPIHARIFRVAGCALRMRTADAIGLGFPIVNVAAAQTDCSAGFLRIAGLRSLARFAFRKNLKQHSAA